jgi:putative hemolysin
MKPSTSGNSTIPQAYSDGNFSYARPHDPLLKRWVIKTVERLTGSRHIQGIYNSLKAEGATAYNFWGHALEKLHIELDYDERQLAKIPASGPLVIIANHPFGLVDGAILLHLTTRIRHDFFLLINEVLAHEPLLAGHLLPVDFRKTKEAMATNLLTRQLVDERLTQDQALVIFPGGGVATVNQSGGALEEFPWRPFIAAKIHEHQCPVVPIYFHGRNSWLFHWVSRISVNLRLGLLLHEVMNKRGRTLRVKIGDPIPYENLRSYRNRQALMDYLKEKTMNLAADRGTTS